MNHIKTRLFFAGFVLCSLILSSTIPTSAFRKSESTQAPNQSKEATVTCYLSGRPTTVTMPTQTAQDLQDLFIKLAKTNSQDPQSLETQHLQDQILSIAETSHLLPKGMTAQDVHAMLQLQGQRLAAHQPPQTIQENVTDSERYCNFITWGDGSATPIIILPRLIPIIQLPIPRIYIGWTTDNGWTSVGGLKSRTGFIAEGHQKGTALGFWGIGFSIFLPPVSAYGLFGYALYAKVTAQHMEQWPPNIPPEVNAVYPPDGAVDVPISTTNLQFNISDGDNDLMNYTVTTSPDAGSANGFEQHDGTYTVPVHLQSSTTYSWTIDVNDGEDTTTKSFIFRTEYLAPQIIDPAPIDGAYYVPITLSCLNFTLDDNQNDPINWTVNTSPDIGSGSGSHVANGRYSVPINSSRLHYNESYTWYVNATDGKYPNHQIFTFTIIKEFVDPCMYVGGSTGIVVKYSKENMTKIAESNYYGGRILRIISDGQYLYVAGFQRGTIWQLWPSNLTVRAESSYYGDITDLACDGTYIYAGGCSSTNKVIQYWASNLTKKQESIDLPVTGILALCYQNNFIYAVGGHEYDLGFIYQFWTSNLTVRCSRSEGSGRFWSVLTVGPNIYVGASCTVDGGVVKQYRSSDLLEINSAPYGGSVDALAFDGSYLYAGGDHIQKVFKYWPSNLTKVGESPDYGGHIGDLSYDGILLYIGGKTTDCVWQIRPSDMAKLAEFPSYEGEIETICTG